MVLPEGGLYPPSLDIVQISIQLIKSYFHDSVGVEFVEVSTLSSQEVLNLWRLADVPREAESSCTMQELDSVEFSSLRNESF